VRVKSNSKGSTLCALTDNGMSHACEIERARTYGGAGDDVACSL
jgi:hypothetical protein